MNTVLLKLFSKYGTLNAPVSFLQFGYKWTISLQFTEIHNVPAVDFKIQCDNIEEGEFMCMELEIYDISTSITQTFQHLFDRQRSSFCYRRIVTGVRHIENGKAIVSFPIDRFLMQDEIGEYYENTKQMRWPMYNPVEWTSNANGIIEISSIKKCYNQFDYRFEMRHITNYLIVTPSGLLKWPKSQEYQVQIEFFEPVFPGIRELMENRKKLLSPEEFYDFIDILGAFYHQWKFDEDRLLHLNERAINMGFIGFMNWIGLRGDFQGVTSSEKCSNILGKKDKMDISGTSVQRYDKVWKVTRIPGSMELQNIYRIVLRDQMQLNVNFFTSKFNGQEYISVGAVLIGNLRYDYHCFMEISVVSEDTTIKQKVNRILNEYQNSVCIPVFCLKQELDWIRGNENGIHFHVSLEIRRAERYYDEHQEISEMPGQNDVKLILEGKSIAVNKNFLAHHVQFFSGLLFNPSFGQHNKSEVEIHTATHKEFIEFLDTLYHGSKLFHEAHYYYVLRLADEWICDKVLETIKKAVKNTNRDSVNKKKLERKFHLGIFPNNPLKREAESEEEEVPVDIKQSRNE